MKKGWNFNNSHIADYAKRDIRKVTLLYLLEMGEKKDVLSCARLVHQELPIRLARRLMGSFLLFISSSKALQKLPFIVGVNPYIKQIYDLYQSSFETIIRLPEPVTQESQALLADKLAELTQNHQNVLPELAQGFHECGKYLAKETTQQFLDGMIKARIGIRVLAEHFLALHNTTHLKCNGIVDSQLKPFEIIKSIADYVSEISDINYAVAPGYTINGHTDTVIAYIPSHLEYMLMELLKNAMRATVEYNQKIGKIIIPEVEISIAKGQSDITIRIRDVGGGISPEHIRNVFEYA